MISSISSSSRWVFLLTAFLISISGCTGAKTSLIGEKREPPHIEESPRFAVLPVYNLSGAPAPLKDIRLAFIRRFQEVGLEVLDEEVLERFMARHRLRYVGGIDEGTAKAFREEEGLEAVFITSLDLYSALFPPKIALTSRLVSTGKDTAILWIDDVGMAGDDSPGLLDLSLIGNPEMLTKKAVERLSESLVLFLSGKNGVEVDVGRKKFRPKTAYQSPVIDERRRQTIAVVPFLNLSERKYAGEIIALQFVRELRTFENFRVIEPGVVRDTMLEQRLIMVDGISLTDAGAILKRLNADLVLSGRVMFYQDTQGRRGIPTVGFSTLLIHRQSREVVWSSRSYNKGDDGVFFFDWGKVNTAYSLASEMVQQVLGEMTR